MIKERLLLTGLTPSPEPFVCRNAGGSVIELDGDLRVPSDRTVARHF
jgi:hypothetical protein